MAVSTRKRRSRIARATARWALAACCVPGLSANPTDIPEDAAAESDSEGSPMDKALDLLVEGSILRGITIPRYDDESLKLTSVLRAEKLVLVDDGAAEGEELGNPAVEADDIRIAFYREDGSAGRRLHLSSATLNHEPVSNDAGEPPGPAEEAPEFRQVIRSTEPVSLRSDELSARGAGLVCDITSRRGFVHGPATVVTLLDQRTSMNTRSRLRSSAFAGATMLVSTAAPAQSPDSLGPGEIAGLDRLAESRAGDFETINEGAGQLLVQAENESGAADDSLDRFLRETGTELEPGEPVDLTATVADPDNLPEMKLPAELTCERGFYFEDGLLVFLENVKIDHPDFTLSGADEVKVFFDQEENADEPDAEDTADAETRDQLLGGTDFGTPSKIVAVGNVVFRHERDPNDPDDQTVRASGRQMVYDIKGEDIIIRGGQPWVISEQIRGRITKPDGYFRINRGNGDVSASGSVKAIHETADE